MPLPVLEVKCPMARHYLYNYYIDNQFLKNQQINNIPATQSILLYNDIDTTKMNTDTQNQKIEEILQVLNKMRNTVNQLTSQLEGLPLAEKDLPNVVMSNKKKMEELQSCSESLNNDIKQLTEQIKAKLKDLNSIEI